MNFRMMPSGDVQNSSCCTTFNSFVKHLHYFADGFLSDRKRVCYLPHSNVMSPF